MLNHLVNHALKLSRLLKCTHAELHQLNHHRSILRSILHDRQHLIHISTHRIHEFHAVLLGLLFVKLDQRICCNFNTERSQRVVLNQLQCLRNKLLIGWLQLVSSGILQNRLRLELGANNLSFQPDQCRGKECHIFLHGLQSQSCILAFDLLCCGSFRRK